MINDELQELLDDFLLESDERLATIESRLLDLGRQESDERDEALEAVRRDLHTLKGNSGMMGLDELQTLAHALEDRVAEIDPRHVEVQGILAGLDEFKRRLDDVRPAAADRAVPADSRGAASLPHRSTSGASLRVSSAELDRLLELSTELVMLRNRLAEIVALGTALDPEQADYAARSASAWGTLEETRLDLEHVLTPLDDRLRRLRMVPLKSLFGRLQRIVHDESARLRKSAELVTRGGHTPLDAALVEVATETLGHLVRNAIVHGIEDPATRSGKGKRDSGTVLLEATVRGRWVEIEVLDDGAGIDEARLRSAAHRLGLDAYADLSLQDLVFRSGLSAHSQADASAGRGVGTAAVLDAVHRYGGTIDIDTAPDIGSRFLLRLPLTVALTDALIVEVENERFALPIGNILETSHTAGLELRSADGARFLQRSGLNIPATDLADFFRLDADGRSREYAVILTSERKLQALLVDRLGDVVTIVVTPLDPALGRPLGFLGTTVMGNGDVLMILDPQAFSFSPTELPA